VQAAAERRAATIAYHLKIDTGMNRLGFRHGNLRRTLPDLLARPNLRLDAVYTHFASADVPESGLFGDQRRRFEEAIATVGDLGGRPRLRHACNSAALLRDSRVWYDAVRPGLLLYGIVPPPLASTIALTPAMSLTSRVVAVKGLRPGEGVGYGWCYHAREPRTVAVVPAGYADGLDTRLCAGGHVLIRGQRVPIVGAVSMDMLTVDVTDLEQVEPGDEVVILGRQGPESWQQIDAREMAAAIGTIPWEIVCRLGTRIERQYD
jgi:alanine racemase